MSGKDKEASASSRQELKTIVSKEQTAPTRPLTDLLGAQLKSAYGTLLTNPVPDKILDLIKKLEAEDTGGSQATSSETASEGERQ